jgi:hypothetical protein
MTPEEAQKLHDDLYNMASLLIANSNPCKFSNGKCKAGRSCCSRCEYLSENGCTVRALFRKLHLCYKAREDNDILTQTLSMLMDKAEKYGVLPEPRMVFVKEYFGKEEHYQEEFMYKRMTQHHYVTNEYYKKNIAK